VETTLTIGELARAAAVSAQTLRHYDQIGLLRPSHRTSAGYRCYSALDRARLELIRALRELDVDLASIRELVRGTRTLTDVMTLQLKTTEYQTRLLQRRAAVIRVFLSDSQRDDPERLRRLNALAALEHLEQREFMADQLEKRLRGTGPDALIDAIRQVATIDVPNPTPEQVDAWLELADLVTSPSFATRPKPSAPRAARSQNWSADTAKLYRRVLEAFQSGVSPTSKRGQRVATRWLEDMARRQGTDARTLARNFVARAGTDAHRADRRFWALVAVLRPEVARWPGLVAADWLESAIGALDLSSVPQRIRSSSHRDG